MMQQAQEIREALEKVAHLRRIAQESARIGNALKDIKHVQSRRFAGTYADLFADPQYAAAARFFMQELYGEADYTLRDAQFSRIAPALEHMLPPEAIKTAVDLAKLHALTEELDHAMARIWMSMPRTEAGTEPDVKKYIEVWRAVGQLGSRTKQLRVVIGLGTDLVKLTKTRGLRLMLKMMRGPARIAGLGDLQHFLESGFDTFSAMSKADHAAERFLAVVSKRETKLIDMLFDCEISVCTRNFGRYFLP